jgi:rubrerythrin
MSQTQPEESDPPLYRPAEFQNYAAKLDPGNNLFQCHKCGHYAGDPRRRNFYGTCPSCATVVKFFRIIE